MHSLDVAFEDLMRGAVTTNAGTCLPMPHAHNTRSHCAYAVAPVTLFAICRAREVMLFIEADCDGRTLWQRPFLDRGVRTHGW